MDRSVGTNDEIKKNAHSVSNCYGTRIPILIIRGVLRFWKIRGQLFKSPRFGAFLRLINRCLSIKRCMPTSYRCPMDVRGLFTVVSPPPARQGHFFRFNINRKTTTLFWASNLLKREIETVVQEHKSNTSHTHAHNLVITSWSTAISISLPWNHFRLGKYPVLENTDIQVLNIRVFGGGKI